MIEFRNRWNVSRIKEVDTWIHKRYSVLCIIGFNKAAKEYTSLSNESDVSQDPHTNKILLSFLFGICYKAPLNTIDFFCPLNSSKCSTLKYLSLNHYRYIHTIFWHLNKGLKLHSQTNFVVQAYVNDSHPQAMQSTMDALKFCILVARLLFKSEPPPCTIILILELS